MSSCLPSGALGRAKGASPLYQSDLYRSSASSSGLGLTDRIQKVFDRLKIGLNF